MAVGSPSTRLSLQIQSCSDALKNVLRAAEAVEEFTGIVMSLKMELDDAIGISGENVRPLPEEYQKAIKTLFNRYTEYLAAFEPKETYLKKKVETELGSKLIYLKMRCGGLEADWGKLQRLIHHLFEHLSSLLEPMLAVDEREKSQDAQKDLDRLILSIRKLRKLAG